MKGQFSNKGISTIEQFYEALVNSPDREQLFLVLQLADWVNQTIEHDPANNNALNTSLDGLFSHLNSYKQPTSQNKIVVRDQLYHIFLFANDAIKEILQKTRTKILRDHTLLPFHEVKETDCKSLQWLSKKPGRTVREKLSNLTHIMAVRRVFSADTLENRLFKAFIWRLSYLLDLRNRTYYQSGIHLSDQSEDFFSRIQFWKNSEEYGEITAWRNSPPNNVLLEDKQYRKIWLSWNELSNLDEKIISDIENVSQNIIIYLMWNICSRLKNYTEFKFEQRPFLFDQKTNTFLENNEVLALKKHDDTFDKYLITQIKKEIEIKKNNMLFAKIFFKDNIIFVEKNSTQKKHNIHDKDLTELVLSDLFDELTISEKKKIQSKQERKVHIACDFYNGSIKYTSDNHMGGILEKSLVAQEWLIDKSSFIVNCFSSELITINSNENNKISTITIQDLFKSGDKSKKDLRQKAAFCFAENLSKYLPCNSISYILPDYVNDFDCTEIKKALNSKFHQTAPIPSSIALSVFAERNNYFKDKIKEGDVIVAVDFNDNEIFLTPIKVQYDKQLNDTIPESKGFQYIRYETYSEKIEEDSYNSFLNALSNSIDSYEEIKDLSFEDDLLKTFGIGYLAAHSDKVIYRKNNEFISVNSKINSNLSKFKITLTSKHISNAIAAIGDESSSKSCVYVLKANEAIHFSEKCSVDYNCISCLDNFTEGAFFITEVQKKLTNNYIWFDYLPKLSMSINTDAIHIKEVVLVDKQKISPQLGKAIRIPIKDKFILPKNYKFYHFPLMQGIGNNISKYEAYIESPKFPLKEDLECSLELDYTYGADMPYSLNFVSTDSALSQKYKVKWLNKEDIPFDFNSLSVPEFPQPRSIDYLRNYPSRNRTIDIIKKFILDINSLTTIEGISFGNESKINRKFDDLFLEKNNESFEFSIKYLGEHKRNREDREEYIQKFINIVRKEGCIYYSSFYRKNGTYGKKVIDFHFYRKRILFYTHAIFFGGRKYEDISITDLKQPLNNLKNYIENVINNIECYKNDYISFLLQIYVLIFKNISENIIQTIESDNFLKLLNNDRTAYNRILSCSVSDLSYDWQKHLYNQIRNGRHFYNFAILFIWQNPKVIDTISIKQYKMLLNNLLQDFNLLVNNKFEKLCKFGTNVCSQRNTEKFEFLLGLLRARSRNETFFKEILSPQNDLTINFISVIRKIIYYFEVEGIVLRSNFDIDIATPEKNNTETPPLLRALLMYLNCEKGSGSIRIAVSEKNLTDNDE